MYLILAADDSAGKVVGIIFLVFVGLCFFKMLFNSSNAGGGEKAIESTLLTAFMDSKFGCWAKITFKSGQPCFVSVAQDGIVVKMSKSGLKGAILYSEADLSKAVDTTIKLDAIYPDVCPEGITSPVLRSLVNALLACEDAATASVTLNKPESPSLSSGLKESAALKEFALMTLQNDITSLVEMCSEANINDSDTDSASEFGKRSDVAPICGSLAAHALILLENGTTYEEVVSICGNTCASLNADWLGMQLVAESVRFALSSVKE